MKWLEEKLSEELFNLVVAGQFKRGKSSIINALLGEALLPAGVVPLTSVVTLIRSGKVASAHVEFGTSERRLIPLSQLADYVTERGNPNNAKGVERVVIHHPSPWLAHGVRLVDTPGIGSVYEHNTDEARKYLPQADAVLFVASVDQPVSRAELDFLIGVRQYAGKIFCLLNKVDYLRPEELSESVVFSTDTVRDALGASIPVFPVSARLALEGRVSGNADLIARSGFSEFEEALQRFMAEEKSAAWLTSIARSLQRVVKQVRFTVDLEAKILTEPLERIEANLGLFRREKDKAERDRRDFQLLLQADARRLLKEEVEPTLEEFKQQEQTRIGSAIELWFSELSELPAGKLQSALQERLIAQVRGGYDSWLAREEIEISRAFQSLCARFWSQMQQSVDELMRRSSELFAVDFERSAAEAKWTTESGFYYKFWYEPTSLRILSSSVVLALPKILAGRLILKRTRATALDLIEVHAGRIRHDLRERLEQSVRDAQKEIVSQFESTILSIERAIDGALTTRARSLGDAIARREELASARASIQGLEAGLARTIEATVSGSQTAV
ncbi:MAG TPA: dynamin family protein [Steroidobacteraceae bacterium]|nr:dynamin family protein [Steroidobacteraceae bacterium]